MGIFRLAFRAPKSVHGGVPIQAFQIANFRIYRHAKPLRDPDYLRFIRRLPCVACGKTWWIEAAHTGPHGLGQKASDYRAIPLCGGALGCHKELDRIGLVRFEVVHGLDVEASIAVFLAFYEHKRRGRQI